MPQAPKQDPYQTLGISKSASDEEIRKAYRKLARKHHPDLNPGDKAAEDHFKNVQQAYDLISDKKKRQDYDLGGYPPESPFPGGGGARHPNMDFGGFDFSDAFRQSHTDTRREPGGGTGGGAFKDIFSQFFKGGEAEAKSDKGPEKGADLEYGLNITFWQAIKGTQTKIEITRYDQCATCHGAGGSDAGSIACQQCNGTGSVSQMAGNMKFNLTCPRCGGKGRLKNACPYCHGEGRTSSKEQVDVRIPAGAQDGSRLRVAGKGNAGTMGAAPGDLYITTHVEPHPLFRREGDTIHLKIPITVPEAGLGAKIEVPTIDGKTLLKIPAGTQNNQKFRLRERGVNNSRKGSRGDQIVQVMLQAPDIRDERVKDLLRQLAEVDTEDPRKALWEDDPNA